MKAPIGKSTDLSWLLVALLAGLCGSPSSAKADDNGLYLEKIKPLLRERCYACHGALKQKAKLRVDTAQQLIAADVIETGELLARLTSTDLEQRMPPEGEALHAEEIAEIRRWIAAGAQAPEDEAAEDDPRSHWAFQRVERPEIPMVSGVDHPIDAFLAAKHAEHNLKAQPTAERSLLRRRLYLDVVGLPPTAEQLADPRDLGDIIDELLASPHYGERWGRHWMDVWRYSDWYGLGKQLRNSQKNLWRWRDWIVNSLNDDKGYDRMVHEMLAGDELDPENLDVVAGTGFLTRNYYLFNRTTWLDDTVEHTGKAFLGLTMNCAKCHDHKYDPIEHTDYYRFRAIFEPHQVRLDALPGLANYENDGLPRAFDDHLDAETFLHQRGDPASPDKSKKIAPGVPVIFAESAPHPEPIQLPVFAWAPGLRDYVQEDQLAVARTKLSKQKAALSKANALLPSTTDSDPKIELQQAKTAHEGNTPDRETAVQVAQARVAEAQTELAALEARIAADRHIYLDQKAEAGPAEAVRQEKLHALAKAHLDLLTAESNKVDAAKKNVAAAEQALNSNQKSDADYSPVRGSFKAKETPEHSKQLYAPTYSKTSSGRRTALAKWIISRDNPLAARVAANHIWMRHFGTPIVENVFDFGRSSPRPEYHALLDLLAMELIDSGWSMKHLHRLLLNSQAWQRTSSNLDADAATFAADSTNRFYWRMNPRRMESQLIRDSLIGLADELDQQMGGPAIKADQKTKRRSLYLRHSRESNSLLLTTFDDADVLACYRRSESIVPQQALALANSSLSLKMCAQIAATTAAGSNDREFAKQTFEKVLCRPPSSAELTECEKFLAEVPNRARLVHALVNHNDFIMIR